MDLYNIFRSEDMAWQRHASCLGVHPDLFFPERGASTREAKAVCAGCMVREECLEFALRNGEKFGIWGGTSERERRRIRKARAEMAGVAYKEYDEEDDGTLDDYARDEHYGHLDDYDYYNKQY